MENCINQNTTDSRRKWPTLCVSVDGSFLTSSLWDKELVRPFGGVCVLIKITLYRNTSRVNKLDLAETRGEFIRIGILEGVLGYGLIYKVIHF